MRTPVRSKGRPEGRRLAFAAALLFVILPAAAKAQDAASICDVFADVTSDGVEPRLLVVGDDATPPAFRRGGDEQPGCPGAGAACDGATSPSAGDAVVVTANAGDYACAAFAEAASGAAVSGWLPRSALVEDSGAAAADDWLGTWHAHVMDEIAITPAEDGALLLQGTAVYGAEDPERVAAGAVNVGDISAILEPADGAVAFALDADGATVDHDADASDDSLCRVRLWRLGPYLLAADNWRCGGFNVSFTGLYVRTDAEPAGEAAP